MGGTGPSMPRRRRPPRPAVFYHPPQTVKVLSVELACSSPSGSHTFWANGTYAPGAPGVTGAAINANASALSVMVGSGVYSFALSGW